MFFAEIEMIKIKKNIKIINKSYIICSVLKIFYLYFKNIDKKTNFYLN